jgi:hypothetical protein
MMSGALIHVILYYYYFLVMFRSFCISIFVYIVLTGLLFVFAGTRQNAGWKADIDLQLALCEDDSGGEGGGVDEELSGLPPPRPSEEGGAVVCRPPA